MDIENIEIEHIEALKKLIAAPVAVPVASQESDHVSTDNLIGKKVLVRTYASGVHFGILAERKGREVVLKESRIIYFWNGAFTLNQVVRDGVGDDSKVSVPVNQVILLDAISVYPLTEEIYGNICRCEKDMRDDQI